MEENKKDNSELHKVNVEFMHPPAPNQPQPGTSNSEPTFEILNNLNNVVDQILQDAGITPQSPTPRLILPPPPPLARVPLPNVSQREIARLPHENSPEGVVASTSQPQVKTEVKPHCSHYDHFFFQRFNQLDAERRELTGKCETLQLKLHKSQDENKRVKAKLANVMEQIGEVHERQNKSLEEMIKSALAERVTPITESISVTSQTVTQNAERIATESSASAARISRLQEWLYFEFTSTKDDVKKQNLEINQLAEQLRNINNKLEELQKLNSEPISEFVVNNNKDVNGAGKKNNEAATGGQSSNEGYTPDDGQLPGPSSACVMGNLALRTEEERLPGNENDVATPPPAVTSSPPAISPPPATTSGGLGENGSNNSSNNSRDPPEEMDQDIQILEVIRGCRFCYEQHCRENREKIRMKMETDSGVEFGDSEDRPNSNGGSENSDDRPNSNGRSEESEEPPHVRTRAETRWLRIQAARAANNSSNNPPVPAVNPNSNQEGGQERVRRNAAILARVRIGRIGKSKKGN